MKAVIVLENVTKTYPPNVKALRGINLEVGEREFVCVLGPSGCGKSTALRVIAGFVIPDEGRVIIRGRDYARVPPNRRDIGMVYQYYALFPHLSVFDNVAFGLRMRKVPVGEIRKRVDEALALVKLAGMGGRKPAQLSGGQQQRVALARAIVIEPTVLLLDEPLSNVDAKLRGDMQVELKELHRKLGMTTIYVTHAQDEALSLGDRVVVMRDGFVVHVGRPKEIYFSPADRFVADFVGRANFFEGRLIAHDARVDRWLFLGDDGERLEILRDERELVGRRCCIFIRPESLRVDRASGRRSAENTLEGEVEDVLFAGVSTTVSVRLQSGKRVLAEVALHGMATADEMSRGDKVIVELSAGCIRPVLSDTDDERRYG